MGGASVKLASLFIYRKLKLIYNIKAKKKGG
jgi:hypothetical protein